MTNNKHLSNIFKNAKKLIEQGWTQGANARDAYGTEVPTMSKRAKCFCAYGAIHLAYIEYSIDNGKKFDIAYGAFCQANNFNSIMSWNDASNNNKENVLTAFDKAIAYCEKEN